MAKNTKWNLGYLLTTLAFTGLMACAVWADPLTQSIPFTLHSAPGSGCPGTVTGFAKMTNSMGTFWITPPANTTNGTLTDASGFPAPYVSVACVTRKSDFANWCATNTVTFPATSSNSYQLFIFVKSTPPPPTNGQPIILQITWH